jgi:ComF family protein
VEILKGVLEKEDIREYCIMTIPMHWSRYTLRGFDHMDYLAKKLSKELGVPYIKPLKTRFSKRQSKLSRVKRLENRKNHFTIDYSITLPQKVLLIDDVISTGATAHECAKILKRNGVERVMGVFIASSAEDLLQNRKS